MTAEGKGNTMLARLARAAVFGLGLAALAAPALASTEAHEPEHHHFHFQGPFGTFDRAAMQRGYQIYREVCSSCHSMDHLAFRHLGQKGGPFYDEDYPNPNDNPVVKAIAAEFMIADIDGETGDAITRPGRPSDYFPAPFPNEPAARASNGGALPPDLSVITKARHHGADYVASLLVGFAEPPEGFELRPGMHYNAYFPGGAIAMAPQLIEGRVSYAGETEATPEQMARDVAEFLAWASEPEMEARKRMGFTVLVYLAIFAVLMWFSYKQIWRNVKH